MEVSLEGKVALVTGTGPNIGTGLALALARYGAKVACNDIRPDQADAAVRRIERNGGVARAFPGDVASDNEVQAYVGKVLDAWGKIDILVNSAAILGGKGVLDYDVEDFNRQLIVNCTGNFLNTKYVAKSMIERKIKGSILCLVSNAGWTGQPNNIGYSTSKGGIANFVRSAAMDLATYGIRVNSLTPISTKRDNPEAEAELSERGLDNSRPGAEWIPLGEQPTPSDYGHLVAFLASDMARLITACDFRVDGGAMAKHWHYVPPAEKMGPLPLVPIEDRSS